MTATQICFTIFTFIVLGVLIAFPLIKMILSIKKSIIKKSFDWTIIVFGVIFFVLLLFSLSIISALYYAVITALKGDMDLVLNYGFEFPVEIAFDNFVKIFNSFKVNAPTTDGLGMVEVGFISIVINSVIYVVGCTLVGTLVPCIVAYLTARFKYKFNAVVYWVVILSMILPIVGNVPSMLIVLDKLNLYNNFVGMIVMKAHFLTPYFLVFHSTFRTIPADYSEAAKIDGAGNTRIMFLIMFPLVKNMILIIGLMNFIALWNDYTTILYYLPSYPNLAYSLYLFKIETANGLSSTNMRLMGCVIAFVPTLIMFLCFKKQLIGNLSLGGIKG